MTVRSLVMFTITAAVAVSIVSGCAPATDAVPPTSAATAGELSGTLTVYAAASIAPPFEVLRLEFARFHDQLDFRSLVVGGSSALTTQLGEGAPADVLVVADESTMAAAIAAGAVEAGAVVVATNTLTLVVPLDNPGRITDLTDLADTEQRVVLCAVEVPCGAASRRLLNDAGLEVFAASVEHSVSAVLTKVATGEADAGLVYRTDASRSTAVRAIPTAGAEGVVNRYPIATVRSSLNPEAARAFIEFVSSARGQKILSDFGFGPP